MPTAASGTAADDDGTAAAAERSALLQHDDDERPESEQQPEQPELPWRAGWGWLRAALVLSSAFFMHFTAWHATQNLQSTLPLHPTVSGTAALGIVYITHCLSGPFAPSVVSKLGPRRCVVVGQICYGTFIAAQLFPRPYTIYPAAALVGLSASPLWAAQGLLITHLAVGFATARRSPDVASATGTFNGVFECAYGALTNIVGSVLSSLAFLYGDHVVQPDGSPSPPTDETVRALFSLFLCFLFVGIALVILGLPIKYSTPAPPRQERDLRTTLRLLRERCVQA
jgi:MFS family permease